MPDPNVFTDEFETDRGLVRGSRVGAAAGARQLGCSLYVIEPGGQAAPYHLHHANEELLIVLEGTAEVRTPDGLRDIEAGGVVVFPTGSAGAHRIRNTSGGPVRYVIVSTTLVPEVAEYPDTGALVALTAAGGAVGFAAGSAGKVSELVAEALAAERR